MPRCATMSDENPRNLRSISVISVTIFRTDTVLTILHKRVRVYRLVETYMLVGCLLASLGLLLQVGDVVGQTGCSVLYEPGNGWAVEMCTSDPQVPATMTIVLNGETHGQAAALRIYHQSQAHLGAPQIAIIYASGYVRLKQNADPDSPIPFGPSFILGPAYWSAGTGYHPNPQLTRLEIDTSWLPTGPLRMRAEGTNADFDVSYELALPLARDRQTRLHVTQTYTATAAVTIDPARRAEAQAFKLAQISSMFINSACDGGQTGCHDSNAARFIDVNGERQQVGFTAVSAPSFIFDSPLPLGTTWLDALHTDDQGWQGNTPNVRIALDALPADHTITPQGWITAETDPNEDNVALWLHDDGPASQNWTAGQSGRVGYWLLAQDDPPDPWADLDLRPGQTFLDFEGAYNCFRVEDVNQPTSTVVSAISGYTDTALQLAYNLGSNDGNWAQLRCNFDPPLDLSDGDHLRMDWRGDPQAVNSLQIGLINPAAGTEYIFAADYRHVAHHGWWGQLVIPFQFLQPWTPGTSFNPAQVSALFVSVIKHDVNDVGGVGRIAIDKLTVQNVANRTVPPNLEAVDPNLTASNAAVAWLITQQKDTGLLKSWEEEGPCLAHTYDQALALIVFAREQRWVAADALVEALGAIQELDGSWLQTHDCLTREALTSEKWEGDIAWAIYALNRYLALGGAHPQAAAIRDWAAGWLSDQLNPTDGCFSDEESTEATIDAWWALATAGPDYVVQAEGLKNCLLTFYWDEAMGRFKGGRNWWQPYLDNQTWGAAFLRAIGHEEDARRALSYAWETLRLPAQGGQLFGFDGQAGPWSVWNEGTGQYVALGGAGARDLLLELLAQQRADGAMPGSPDDFSGAGVWTTRWHGVAPTAWLYNALHHGPFILNHNIYLPVVVSEDPSQSEVSCRWYCPYGQVCLAVCM